MGHSACDSQCSCTMLLCSLNDIQERQLSTLRYKCFLLVDSFECMKSQQRWFGAQSRRVGHVTHRQCSAVLPCLGIRSTRTAKEKHYDTPSSDVSSKNALQNSAIFTPLCFRTALLFCIAYKSFTFTFMYIIDC